MQQWWFDNGLGLKSVYLSDLWFSLIFTVFINIHKAVVGSPAMAGPLFWPKIVLAGPLFRPNMIFF